jgi:hypothetical protein
VSDRTFYINNVTGNRVYYKAIVGPQPAIVPFNGLLWIDTSTSPWTLKSWDENQKGYVAVGYAVSNESGQVPISNGIVCTNLNADMVDGQHAAALEKIANKGVANGYAELDGNALILLSRIPDVLTGKDADTVDGQHGSYYLARANHTGTQAPSTISPQGSDSGLDADELDGQDGSYYLNRTNHTGTQPPNTISPQGSGSGLDADMTDGLHVGNSSGQIPVSNGTRCTGLNADMTDGFHASQTPGANQIPVLGASGNLVLPADISLNRLQAGSGFNIIGCPLLYLDALGKTNVSQTVDGRVYVVTADAYTDLAFETFVYDDIDYVLGRLVNSVNFYQARISTGSSAADHEIWKCISGTFTKIAYEAVNLNPGHWLKFSIQGTTLKSYRDFAASAQISVTDTSLTSGSFGKSIGIINTAGTSSQSICGYFRAAGSPVPQVLGFYEVPITGTGTPDDPYRAKLPEELAPHPTIKNKTSNLVSLTHSAFIPTNPDTGKPLHDVAIVRAFYQPDRASYLKPHQEALQALEAMSGVRKLTAEQARNQALDMDKKLHLYDLISLGEHVTEDQVKEYIEHVKSKSGVDRSHEATARYLCEEKGW